MPGIARNNRQHVFFFLRIREMSALALEARLSMKPVLGEGGRHL